MLSQYTETIGRLERYENVQRSPIPNRSNGNSYHTLVHDRVHDGVRGMKAIGYARVSTKDQSLDVQVEQIKRYCDYRNIDLARLYTDKATGANTDRPEFQEMLTDIETNAHGAEVIIVWKLDRIGRSLKNLIEIVDIFKSKELGFVCINANIDTTSNEGRLFFHMMASFAEYERALINERTSLGREAALEKGVKFGRPVVDVDVAEARRRIADGVPKTKVAKDMEISRSTLHRRLNNGNEK